MTSKLDQIEQILAQTALMQQTHAEKIAGFEAFLDRFAEETDRRLAALESFTEQMAMQQQAHEQAHAEAIARIDARIDRFAAETERRIVALETSMDNLSRQVDNTSRTVDAMGLNVQNLISNTTVAQARIEQIWEYLMRQTPNGDSPTS